MALRIVRTEAETAWDVSGLLRLAIFLGGVKGGACSALGGGFCGE